MNWPKIIIEKNEKRFFLAVFGVFVIILLVALNVLLKFQIRNKQEELTLSSKQFLSLKKQAIKPEFTKIIKLDSKCPSEQAGNPDANLTIKYFYSPVCFWCVLEDQNLAALLQKEGQAFKLEKYNRENCDSLMQKYNLSLTPGFVFSTKGDKKEYTVDGYISKENLTKVICDVTGYCLASENKQKNDGQLQGQKVRINFQ